MALIIFPTGLQITPAELACLQHVAADPEAAILTALQAKAESRRTALIKDWHATLAAEGGTVPANAKQLAQVILDRPDYKSRHTQEVALNQAGNPSLLDQRKSGSLGVVNEPNNLARLHARSTANQTVTLFSGGITIDQNDADCILAYVDNLEDWVVGALLGDMNRGKKKLVTQYRPVLFDDPRVKTMPADDDGLIGLIVKRKDYRTLPQQQRGNNG